LLEPIRTTFCGSKITFTASMDIAFESICIAEGKER